jgi:SAM-dependent methyltransferase
MKWSGKTAEKYDAWAETPRGRYVLNLEKAFLQKMMAPWPRRKQSLLDIGCGTGIFTAVFWEAGFSVTALDSSSDMLARARARLGARADFHVGVGEHLPFDDNEFDFCTLITVLEFCEQPEKVAAEAVRVARKGVLIVFLNKWSLYYLSHGRPGRDNTLSHGRWFSWPEVRSLLPPELVRPRIHARSILPGPVSTWKSMPGFSIVNGICLPVWLGSFAAMRVDFGLQAVKTPLVAWKAEPRPAP